ncbi:nicotinate-nucleotide--dimethylbenzimidazole phosphoribosyltransferase [Roseicitreum antarcticum]|uniref:Nicotinate-nucleotide--dimethylbenzimidazole phosphoribosyltransferase n=1 Tax=Roseicitreum antarcticum TaxID=564137 RepID=A0A1H3CAI1_9RHOB|nr:nicotinate-nucleotide--dimethylbenzimidazole phosphoribosyltransferase [Roseicitreum antarcticum]SDX51192.1 nicotinate-nucleotide-dimethylbenzimidazole phosphoribosyltransferase [Roseicitreum antarcticum]
MTDQDRAAFRASVQHAIDTKTKPPGSLGRIEDLAMQVALVQRSLTPRMAQCTLTIFAADHGIATEGVSAFPQAVTRQMVGNFLAGGAAANVFAAQLGIAVQVVDAGVAGPAMAAPGLIDRRVGAGTASFLRGPAMTPAQVEQALAAGTAIAGATSGDALAFGEMGIGNTATAAILAHKLTALPLDVLVGRGTGLDDAGVTRKHDILARAAARVAGTLTPMEVLAEYGGFEIVMMAGAMRATAQAGRVVLVDGFIATVAALAAVQLAPEIRPALVFAHQSAEAGHSIVLEWLQAQPLLSLDMRLGEGTGALLAWPMVQAAAAMLRDMASFDSAGVSSGVDSED